MPAHLDEVGSAATESLLPASVRQAVARMEAEYREMPGLMLTIPQAQRLWGLERATCTIALATLLQRRFLKQAANGLYLRERPG